MPLTTISVGGVSAEIVIDGARKGNDNQGGGPWREVVYKVAWGDSDTFMDNLMGINTPVVTGGSVIFPLPHPYPGNLILWCTEVWAEGRGTPQPDAKLIAYDYAFVHAVYRVPRWDVPGTDANNAFGGQPIPWCRDEVRGFSKAYKTGAGILVDVATGAQTVTKTTERFLPHVELVRTRFMLPYLDLDLYCGLIECVNLEPMWGRDKGTIRFESWDSAADPQTDGSVMQQVTMRFVWRPYDWNAEQADDSLAWFVAWDGTDYKYPYKDFAPLFE